MIPISSVLVLNFEPFNALISVNPTVILSGFDGAAVSVGTTMTATCTIDRVHPELGPDDFQMRWGAQTIMSTGSQNDDKSYRYKIPHTHTVTNDDNGTVMECLVNPGRGQSSSMLKTLIVNAQGKLSQCHNV